MTVRAKFKVNEIVDRGQNGSVIRLQPVTSGSEENKLFYKYTPSGNIELSTINEDAAKQFKVGAEFYVDFTPAG